MSDAAVGAVRPRGPPRRGTCASRRGSPRAPAVAPAAPDSENEQEGGAQEQPASDVPHCSPEGWRIGCPGHQDVEKTDGHDGSLLPPVCRAASALTALGAPGGHVGRCLRGGCYYSFDSEDAIAVPVLWVADGSAGAAGDDGCGDSRDPRRSGLTGSSSRPAGGRRPGSGRWGRLPPGLSAVTLERTVGW